MTVDESIRDNANKVSSSVEEVECSQLPINVSGKQVELCFIPAYCDRCKKETIHIVYREDSDLYIKCHECESKYGFGDRIIKFVKIYCPKCQRVTVHGIYKDYRGLHIKCIGCGRSVYITDL